MKFEVSVERHYPHPLASVWDGLTTNKAISEWLLETKNFVPKLGHKFEMTCVDDSGRLDIYRCEVLERFRSGWPYKLDQLASVLDET